MELPYKKYARTDVFLPLRWYFRVIFGEIVCKTEITTMSTSADCLFLFVLMESREGNCICDVRGFSAEVIEIWGVCWVCLSRKFVWM